MERSTKTGEKITMSEACVRTSEDDVREASQLMQTLFTRGTLGTRIRDAQLALRTWGNNRVYDIFKGRAKRIDGWELETLRAMKRARQLKEAREEYVAVTDDIARLEALLSQSDAPFHSETLAALGTIRRSLDRSRIEGGDK